MCLPVTSYALQGPTHLQRVISSIIIALTVNSYTFKCINYPFLVEDTYQFHNIIVKYECEYRFCKLKNVGIFISYQYRSFYMVRMKIQSNEILHVLFYIYVEVIINLPPT